jgi:hypothetical protein
LADTVGELRIHAGARPLYFVPPESIKRRPPIRHGADDPSKWSYMYHPNRERVHVRVPGRRWAVIAEVIDGRIAVLVVHHEGMLRPVLDALDRRT